MRKIKFENNKYYHVFNIGANKANIFFSDEDRKRFLWSLRVFNDVDANFISVRLKENLGASLLDLGKDRLVDILCIVLMPNHFHLLLKQVQNNGISKFMHKLGTSYTNYVNLKYGHSGILFQGPFKAVEIESDEQLTHLSRYIHLNPVELVESQWKEEGIKDLKNIRSFLRSYKWSSYRVYLGEADPVMRGIIVNNNLINDLIPADKYQEFIEDWFNKVKMEANSTILGAKLLE